MRVTTSFVRELRKIFLQDDGKKPLEGYEEVCYVLLTVHKSIQQGAYEYAIDFAARNGFDLGPMYEKHIADAILGGKWEGVEDTLRQWGTKGLPHPLSFEKPLTKVRRGSTGPCRDKTALDKPFGGAM